MEEGPEYGAKVLLNFFQIQPMGQGIL